MFAAVYTLCVVYTNICDSMWTKGIWSGCIFQRTSCSRTLAVSAEPPAVRKHPVPHLPLSYPCLSRRDSFGTNCEDRMFGKSVWLSCSQIYGLISVEQFATMGFCCGCFFHGNLNLTPERFKLVSQRKIKPRCFPTSHYIERRVLEVSPWRVTAEVLSGLKILVMW